MPDDKLESLMAELRAIELWDRLPEGTVLLNKIDRAGGVEARRIRRLEINREINALTNQVEVTSCAIRLDQGIVSEYMKTTCCRD